jgi:Flp pilus assembly protein TadB
METTASNRLTFEFLWDAKEHRRMLGDVARHRPRSGSGSMVAFLLRLPLWAGLAVLVVQHGITPVFPWMVAVFAYILLLSAASPYLATWNVRRTQCCIDHPSSGWWRRKASTPTASPPRCSSAGTR